MHMKHHSKNFRNVPYPRKFWAYTLFQTTFLLSINVLSRKSHFVGSCIFFFISPMGIVSFFVSWRCIAGSGKHSIMNQGKRLRDYRRWRKMSPNWYLLWSVCIYTYNTHGVHVCLPNFIYTHIWIKTKAVSWSNCLSIFQWVTEVKVLKWAVFTAFLFFYCVKAKEEVAMVDSQRDAFMFI